MICPIVRLPTFLFLEMLPPCPFKIMYVVPQDVATLAVQYHVLEAAARTVRDVYVPRYFEYYSWEKSSDILIRVPVQVLPLYMNMVCMRLDGKRIINILFCCMLVEDS